MAHPFGFRLLLAAAVLTAGLAAPGPLSAQDASPPAPAAGETTPADNPLDSILATLEQNIADYLHSVPNFLCKEHVVSRMEPTANASGFMSAVTDSIFRVHRVSAPNDQMTLEESRTLTAINGKPPVADTEETSRQLNGPMAVFGIFSGGLNLVSASAKNCFRYRLHPARARHPSDKIVIDFEDLPTRQRDPTCPYTDKTSGRAFIQPSTLRVVRIEAKMREYEMQPGVKETWDWSIDYAPVTLGGKSFWMPTTIRSTAVPSQNASSDYSPGTGGRRGSLPSGSPAPRPLTYSLDAKYSDYHRLTVVSRIVPTTGSAAEDEPGPEPIPSPAP